MQANAGNSFEFGSFRLIPSEGMLLRDGDPVALPPKVIDTLALLVDRHGHVVSKDEFMDLVWPETYVEETNLSHNISLLRKVLGMDSDGNDFIDTIPKRGYRFAAPVRVVDAEDHEISRPGLSSEAVSDAARRPPQEHVKTRWRVAFGGLLVVLIAVLLYHRAAEPDPPATIRTLAVLPFESLVSADDTHAYLGLGLADRLIGQLAGVEEIVVRPTSAVRDYAGEPRDIAEIGRALDVEVVLDGNVQHDGNRVHLSVQLVRVADGAALWATTLEEPFGDLYRLQDSLAAQLAEALALHLTGEQQRQFGRRPTQSAEAYRLYLQGRYAWNRRTPESLAQSKTYFQQAIAEDPAFALAHAGLADAYNLQADYGTRSPHEAYAQAKAAARRALQLDDSLAEAHAALAFALLYNDWDWQQAELEFDRAIKLSPHYASAHQWSAYPLVVQGRFADALERVQRARELDPVSPIIQSNLALVLYQARRPDEAIEACRAALDLDPTFHVAHWILGLALADEGRFDHAVSALGRARELSEASPDVTAALAYVYGRAGRGDEARDLLAGLRDLSERRYVPAYLLAEVHVGLAETDAAFHWLEVALGERQPYMLYLAVEPTLDPIRSDSRYPDLLRRAGLPDVAGHSAAAAADRN